MSYLTVKSFSSFCLLLAKIQRSSNHAMGVIFFILTPLYVYLGICAQVSHSLSCELCDAL